MAGVQVTNRLPDFIAERKRAAVAAVTKCLIVGASNASVYTPIATSVLLNSQYRRVDENGTQIVGTVGYTAEYARWVHDPAVKQTFRRATAKKEFLRLGFEDSQSMIQKILKQAMRPKS